MFFDVKLFRMKIRRRFISESLWEVVYMLNLTEHEWSRAFCQSTHRSQTHLSNDDGGGGGIGEP